MAWASSSTPRSSSFPFRVVSPVVALRAPMVSSTFSAGCVFVEFAVGVAGEGDHPGEHGERVRFGELAVFDEQVLHEVAGVGSTAGGSPFMVLHDGPGLLDADGAGGEGVGQAGQHRWGGPAGQQWLREDGAGGGDPGGGVVARRCCRVLRSSAAVFG